MVLLGDSESTALNMTDTAFKSDMSNSCEPTGLGDEVEERRRVE
jgi:hypothetical protein